MIKVSLIMSFGLVAAALLRKKSAALRHGILAATIAAAAVTPLLELVAPKWQLPVRAGWISRPVEPVTLTVPVRLTDLTDGSPAAGTSGTAILRRVAPLRLAGVVWTAGIVINLSILSIGLARLASLASRSRRVVHEPWAHLAAALSRDYGLRRQVLLLQSDHPSLLATWGLRRPRVILPRDALAWPPDRARIVLGHELAHVQRGDWPVQLAAELLRSVYWFNPLVWIACSRLRQESERACDDAVLNLGVGGPDYAAHLLDLARAFKELPPQVFPAPAMARPSSLERRVSAMLNARLNRAPISRSACAGIVIAVLGISVPIAGLVASAQSGPATFSGSLVDAVGRILPDTTLVLANMVTKEKRQTESDQAGHFVFADLTAGDYLLEANKPGFATSQGRISLEAGQNLVRQVALQVGSLSETIHLTASPGGSGSAAPTVRTAPRRSVSDQPELDPCSQSSLGGCITQPVKLRDVKPVYPPRQRDAGIGAQIEIDARIGTDGFMKDFRLAAPADPDFVNATIDALRQWLFSQTRLDGVPVEVNMHVSVSFSVE
jgi:beta-lactamase regulating signal transducer with metallopeptidase domain